MPWQFFLSVECITMIYVESQFPALTCFRQEQLQERELTEPAPRTFEDLQMYHQFFPELYELDVSKTITGLFTLPETDSDSDSCPTQKYEVGSQSESVHCEHVLHSTM